MSDLHEKFEESEQDEREKVERALAREREAQGELFEDIARRIPTLPITLDDEAPPPRRK